MSDDQRWDIQGFHDGDCGRAAWSTGLTGKAAVVGYISHALRESDSVVFLIRRGPQVRMDDALVHPYRLVAADAHDRIARHLWTADGHSDDLWDNHTRYLTRAAAILRAITVPETANLTYTDPSVLAGVEAGASWVDPEMDPTRIDWPARQTAALIPFEVVDGRPVNPAAPTGIRYGRNELGHWGEQVCADAIVTADDDLGQRWIVMVERRDGHGWALPGGKVDPGESPTVAAARELAEETGLRLPAGCFESSPARYVPDPRASDEAWMVTVPSRTHLGVYEGGRFPAVVGADDARRAAWVRADSYRLLVRDLADRFDGGVFPAHIDLIHEHLTRKEDA